MLESRAMDRWRTPAIKPMLPANYIHDLGFPPTNNNSVNGSGGARPKTRPGQAIGTE